MARAEAHVPGETGIWIFILGDMCLYGTLFASFMIDRSRDVSLYDGSSASLHPAFGAANAALLLTASLLVALGIRSVRAGAVRRGLFWGAIACSLGFVADKAVEYTDLIAAGHSPASNAFFTYYFVLTGIHLTHLLAGTGCLLFLARTRALKVSAMETAASFWHVVDLLWIVLFCLLYVVR